MSLTRKASTIDGTTRSAPERARIVRITQDNKIEYDISSIVKSRKFREHLDSIRSIPTSSRAPSAIKR